MVRSVTAVVVGYLVFAVSAVALFALLGREPHAPASAGFMATATVYGIAWAGVAGYLAARIAGRRPLLHGGAVAAVIAIGAILSIPGRPDGGTIWSQLAALIFMAPSALAGGWLRQSARGSVPRP